MCLHIKGKYEETKRGKPLPRIANRDRIVYKVVLRYGSTLLSYHKKYTYTLGVLNKSALIAERGIYYSNSDKYRVDKGLHSYKTKERAKQRTFNSESVVVKCRIPKGAKYYLGEDDIVSNRIMLEKIII